MLPDFTYLRENAERIEALVATHGHEDHVGGIQFLLREVSFPIYGSALTLGLARNRIEEAGLLGRTEPQRRRATATACRSARSTSSSSRSPTACPTPTPSPSTRPRASCCTRATSSSTSRPVDDRRTDLARIGQLAKTEGIRVLLADSTNAEEAGYAPSERSVGGVLRALFATHRDRRIITASFASHLHRIQQIADAAIDSGRKVATLGLSMRKNVQLGMDLGVVHIPASSFVDIEDIDRYPPGEICVISTGSQGEPMSALALLARGENRFVKLSEHDTVILSSHAIPGNESNVNRVMDGLLKAGADVVHSGIVDVHATGHAQADELKTYLSIAQPEWYVPVHGEFRHLMANARLGELMGVPRDQVIVCENGDVLEVTGARRRAGRAGARRVPLRRRHRRRRRDGRAARPARAGQRRGGGRRRHRRHARPARCSSGRRSSPAGGSTRRRPRTCSTRRATRSPRPWRRRWRRVSATSRRSSATCAGRPASSSTTAPGAGR